MPEFWQFPTVSMGLGPLMAIYQARFMKYLAARDVVDPGRPKGLGVHGRRRDGRAGVDGRDLARRPREARQPRVRDQLQPAAPRRAGAREREDHPGARDELPRRRLERDQGDLGLRLGSAARERHRRLAPPADGGGGRRRVPDLQVEGRRVRPRALLRQVPRDARDGGGLDRRADLGAPARRPRPAEGLCRLRRRRPDDRPADRDPREDDQGLRHGRWPARAGTSRTSRRR